MAFDIRVVDPGISLFVQIGAGLGIDVPPHRVTPVRFARAVSGLTDPAAPDIDDHGFVDAVHGPAVGLRRGDDSGGSVLPGPEVRVAVIRDRIEPAAKLFPVLNDSSVQLISPLAGNPLDESGDPFDPTRGADVVVFQSVSTDSAVHDCTLSIHHGSVAGPILAQMLIRVYPVKLVVVQIHRIRIRGVAPTTSAAQMDTVFGMVNGIFAQAGVRFVLVRDATGQPLMLDDDFDTGGSGPGVLFTSQFFELAPVSHLSSKRGMLNVYVCHDFSDGSIGIGVPRSVALSNNPPINPALFVQDEQAVSAGQRLQALAATVAHEIGHTLNLEHFQQSSSELASRCQSLWARRSLMYTELSLKEVGTGANRPPDFSASSKVGYGTITIDRTQFFQAGELLSTKLFKNFRQSDQIDQLRKAIDARTFTL